MNDVSGYSAQVCQNAWPTLTADNLTKAANFVKGIGSFALKPSTHAGLRQISSGVGKLTSGYGLKNSTGAVKTFTNTMTKRGGFVGLGQAIMDPKNWINALGF